MQPQDDPEARIRELERPLADIARNSELGTQPYPATDATHGGAANAPYGGADAPYGFANAPYGGADPAYGAPTAPYGTTDPFPPPPPNYGAPFGAAPNGAPPQTSGGSGTGLVVGVIVFVFALIVGAGVVAGVVWFKSGSSSDATGPTSDPGVFGGGGSLDTPTPELPVMPSVPSMPTIPIPNLPPDLPSGGQVTTQGDLISVNGIEQNRTIDCNNCSVDVNGVRNTIIVTGHCVRLNVNGIGNQVTVDAADDITASGFDNHVIYHSGSPQVNNSGGSNNIVEQG